MGKTKEYTNGEVTVIWEAEKCIHSAICAKGLPKVFRPRLRPWIKLDEDKTETIVNQVKQCPSGALRYYMNNEKEETVENSSTKAQILEDGPLLVHGTLTITHKDGTSEIKENTTAFCRCGHSNNKPFCDGAHTKAGFKG
ncbi:(4Fe-4S)-binding protein [Seonamhaeicola sp. ML3]|uniref:(4Fe-4S)-binding protein n=1 Tax=Seonamhaeicola sp. ML3 TaxID=2937786 RepID=UPI00200C73C0|nr:(4Fe-4S)-binding protein [Seonamhaeicola sp. ML3]